MITALYQRGSNDFSTIIAVALRGVKKNTKNNKPTFTTGPQVRVLHKTAKKPLGISAPFLSSDSPRSFVYPESLQNIKRDFGFPTARCSVDINCTAQLKSRDQGSVSLFLDGLLQNSYFRGEAEEVVYSIWKGREFWNHIALFKQIRSLTARFFRTVFCHYKKLQPCNAMGCSTQSGFRT